MNVAPAWAAGRCSARRIETACCVAPRRLDAAHLGDHLDLLYRAARAMCGSGEEAEDLVVQAIARVRKKPRLHRSEKDVAYVLRVLRSTFASHRRAAQRRPEPTLHHSDLYRTIASLPDDLRDALIAIDLMGLSYGQAARALRVREATITTRLHCGRRQVADMLEPAPA